jgi:hypothetical protein
LTLSSYVGHAPTDGTGNQTSQLTLPASGLLDIIAGSWGGVADPASTLIFTGTSKNRTTIMGNALFDSTSFNYGTVMGNASFYDLSSNPGTVEGTATFNDESFNSGTDPNPVCNTSGTCP